MAIIYNQMGNAYFNLQDYAKALEYHKKDLELSEQFGDEPGRAKACGNVGNALQLLGDYDEAILYLLRNLDISKKLNDSVNVLFNSFWKNTTIRTEIIPQGKTFNIYFIEMNFNTIKTLLDTLWIYLKIPES